MHRQPRGKKHIRSVFGPTPPLAALVDNVNHFLGGGAEVVLVFAVLSGNLCVFKQALSTHWRYNFAVALLLMGTFTCSPGGGEGLERASLSSAWRSASTKSAPVFISTLLF